MHNSPRPACACMCGQVAPHFPRYRRRLRAIPISCRRRVYELSAPALLYEAIASDPMQSVRREGHTVGHPVVVTHRQPRGGPRPAGLRPRPGLRATARAPDFIMNMRQWCIIARRGCFKSPHKLDGIQVPGRLIESMLQYEIRFCDAVVCADCAPA